MEVKVTAKKLKNRKLRAKIAKIALVVLILLFTVIYIVLGVIYNGGRFTVTLDPNFAIKSGIVMYEDHERKEKKNRLYAKQIDFMDNISVDWIREDIDKEADGSHNGDNYIAYTFYLENEGPEVMSYWMEATIDDVIRNVDEAIRIMVILNGEKKIYAKPALLTGEAEAGCEKFYSAKLPVLRERADFKPGDIDKYTVVVWLEGDDPDCVDELIGGEIKMHIDFREEHKEQEENKK